MNSIPEHAEHAESSDIPIFPGDLDPYTGNRLPARVRHRPGQGLACACCQLYRFSADPFELVVLVIVPDIQTHRHGLRIPCIGAQTGSDGLAGVECR